MSDSDKSIKYFSIFSLSALDDTDRCCLAALQDDPRGSWHALAERSGIAERTVARRIQRLMDVGAIGVLAELDPIATGQSQIMHLWIRCRMRMVGEVARRLAELPQITLVLGLAGPFDLFVELHLPQIEDINHFLSDIVPRIDGIERVESRLALKIFRQAGQWRLNVQKDEHTWPEIQVPNVTPLSPTERSMVDLLRAKGRASIAELAKDLNMSAPTTNRLLQGLLERRAIRFRVDVEPKLLGFPVEAVIAVQVSAGASESLIARLADIPNTRCLIGTSGAFQLFWHVACEDSLVLWRTVTSALPPLEGALLNEVSVVLRAYKRCGVIRQDDDELPQCPYPG